MHHRNNKQSLHNHHPNITMSDREHENINHTLTTLLCLESTRDQWSPSMVGGKDLVGMIEEQGFGLKDFTFWTWEQILMFFRVSFYKVKGDTRHMFDDDSWTLAQMECFWKHAWHGPDKTTPHHCRLCGKTVTSFAGWSVSAINSFVYGGGGSNGGLIDVGDDVVLDQLDWMPGKSKGCKQMRLSSQGYPHCVDFRDVLFNAFSRTKLGQITFFDIPGFLGAHPVDVNHFLAELGNQMSPKAFLTRMTKLVEEDMKRRLVLKLTNFEQFLETHGQVAEGCEERNNSNQAAVTGEAASAAFHALIAQTGGWR